jgi:hypothetical protein
MRPHVIAMARGRDLRLLTVYIYVYIYMSCFPPINLKHPSAVAGAFRTRVPGIMRETAMYNGCNVSGRVEPSQIGLRAAGLFY